MSPRRYLEIETPSRCSVRLPQEKSPAGDRHRELGVYGLDRDRGTIVLREFYVEGFAVLGDTSAGLQGEVQSMSAG